MKVYKVVRVSFCDTLTSLKVAGTRTTLVYVEGAVTKSPEGEAGVFCYGELSDAIRLKRYVSFDGSGLEIHKAVGIGRPLKLPKGWSPYGSCNEDSLGHPVLRFRSIKLGKVVGVP